MLGSGDDELSLKAAVTVSSGAAISSSASIAWVERQASSAT